MYQTTDLKATLNESITSLIKNKGPAFTAGLLEGMLTMLLYSNQMTDEGKTELVSSIAQHAADCNKVVPPLEV
jgi:hypothetical protein